MTTHRIESLSDCIFAFSMTLLVMNFSFPSVGTDKSEAQVTGVFLREIAKFDRFVFTFVLLAIFWITHHQQFHHIRRTDRGFLWIQVAILNVYRDGPLHRSLDVGLQPPPYHQSRL